MVRLARGAADHGFFPAVMATTPTAQGSILTESRREVPLHRSSKLPLLQKYIAQSCSKVNLLLSRVIFFLELERFYPYKEKNFTGENI
jgi:hypothetical protein